MAISITCPQCQTEAVVPDSAAGCKGTCRVCGGIVRVPPPRRLCSSCDADISDAKRIKDNNGNYLCETCWADLRTPHPSSVEEMAEILTRAFPAASGKATIETTWNGSKSVRYSCPSCGVALDSPLDEAGNREQCPHCQQFFVVPGQAERERLDSQHVKKQQQQFREQVEAAKRETITLRNLAQQTKQLQEKYPVVHQESRPLRAEQARQDERQQVEQEMYKTSRSCISLFVCLATALVLGFFIALSGIPIIEGPQNHRTWTALGYIDTALSLGPIQA